MPGIFPPQLPIALWLVAGAQPSVPGITTLPGGNSAAFRARMTPRIAPEPAPPVSPNPTPASLPRISSRFGYRDDPIAGGRRLHSGVDIPGARGSDVRASAGGTVRFAGWRGGYGNMVEIDHGGGLRTRYGHLDRILVPAGARVDRGEIIALMGSTGRSTGSHLHFELRAQGRAVNPLSWLGAAPPSARPLTPEAAPHLSDFARARRQEGADRAPR